jgi:Na+-driven multidrug efflux pump
MLILSVFLIGFYDVAPETIADARLLILINSSFSWLYYLNAGYFFILRAGGDTRSVLFIDAGFVWVVAVPIAFIIGRFDILLPLHFLIVQALEFAKLMVAWRMYEKDSWLNNLTTA